jgi:flagellar basal body-associated protein FliL
MHLLFIPHALYIAEKRAASLIIIIIIIIIIIQVAIFGYHGYLLTIAQTNKCAPNPDEVNICMVSKAS